MMEILINDQKIQLLPEKAALWVDEGILIVADIHIGKAATLQSAGIPVPEGAMQQDLSKLANLIAQLAVERCIIVGDLIHSKSGVTTLVQQIFADWLATIKCKVDLVFGNHDRFLIKHLPTSWNLQPHHQNLVIGPFCFSHFPEILEDTFVWSGHLHPQFTLQSRNDRLTLPCFQISAQLVILPAFSSFVGGTNIYKDSSKQIYVTTGSEVICL